MTDITLDPSANTEFENDEDLPIEEQARLRGWKPLEEYHGDPKRWRSAEDFMRVGQNDRAILAEENRRLGIKVHRMERQLTELQNTAAEQVAALGEMRELARRADDRGYQRGLAELKAKRSEAVEAGDTTAFDQIEQQITALETERAKVPDKPADPPAPKLNPAIVEFIEANPWYTKDKDLNRTMVANYDIVERRFPGKSVDDYLELAKARTIADYPEKFPDMAQPQDELEPEFEAAPRVRRTVAAVGRPGAAPVRQPRQSSGWESIEDPDERKQAQASYQTILRADPDMPISEYLAIYNNPRADIIELRRQRKTR